MASCMPSWWRNRTMKQAPGNASNVNSRHPSSTCRSVQTPSSVSSHSSQYSNEEALLMMNKSQQDIIDNLTKQLQQQSDDAAQLTSALQAESSKGILLQQAVAALQGELNSTRSARQLAADHVDQLGAELEEMRALSDHQDAFAQQHADTVSALTEQAEALQHKVTFLEKRLALESGSNKCLGTQLQESSIKLAAAELSKNKMSQQLVQLRSALQTSRAVPISTTASDPWMDLLMGLLLLLFIVLPMRVVLGSVLLLCSMFVVGVLGLAHADELMQAGAICWATAAATARYGLHRAHLAVVKPSAWTWTVAASALKSGSHLSKKLRLCVQQLATTAFSRPAGGRDHDQGLLSDDSAELLTGFHCLSSLRSRNGDSSCSNRVSLAGDSRSSLTNDAASGVDVDVGSSDVDCVVIVKGMAMVGKGE